MSLQLENNEAYNDLLTYIKSKGIEASIAELFNDLLNYIKLKGIVINNNEDLDKAFREYLQKGSVSHFYLQVADDHQKKQFRKQLIKNL